jgi:hypothetical protein
MVTGSSDVVSGGWRSSHDSISPKNYAPYLERGYTVFAAGHGCQPRFTIPEIREDVERAVRFIRTNASQWGVKPEALGVTGGSAGGHLSLTLGTMGGPGMANAKDPVDRESSAVQAVACFLSTDGLSQLRGAGRGCGGLRDVEGSARGVLRAGRGGDAGDSAGAGEADLADLLHHAEAVAEADHPRSWRKTKVPGGFRKGRPATMKLSRSVHILGGQTCAFVERMAARPASGEIARPGAPCGGK